MQENKPVLVVGLGNPGNEYKLTRHNVGFMAIDAIAPVDAKWKSEKKALTLRFDFDGVKIILAKPQTFMNNSGESVAQLMQFYKVPLENLVVIHDDMDLKVGTVREKTGGSSAGHNGIKSIDAHCGNNYHRIRIGIGHPRDFNSPISPVDWVLGKFDDEQLKQIQSAIESITID
ncbi:MAG: aminoacyl-tRNA hydrolase [Alphaproteobacteria bacterium]|nr:aminoacyl-tRNA hydrolase [Alphaproteobacteria bacterium]